MKPFLRECLVQVCSGLVVAAIVTLGAMVIHDYCFSPPDLNGPWLMVSSTDTGDKHNPEKMMLLFSLIVIQDDLQIKGTAEKIQEVYHGECREYAPGRRPAASFTGTIERRFFGKDRLRIIWQEQNTGRTTTTSGFFEAWRYSNHYIFGMSSGFMTNKRATGRIELVRTLDSLQYFPQAKWKFSSDAPGTTPNQ